MSEASGIPSWARVGAKVVCVTGASNIAPGTICTIVGLVAVRDAGGDFGVHLAEFVSDFGRFGAYKLRRFRPLVTRSQEQDVAQFNHLLAPTKVDA